MILILTINNILTDSSRRDPRSLVKPPKDGQETDDYKAQLKKVTPTKSRHLILIRHGQYNLDGETDLQNTLTKLG